MTVANKLPYAEAIEAGTIVPLDLKFRFSSGTIAATRVLADGSVVELVEGVDYTLTGGVTDDGGQLVPLAAAAAGTRLRARRATPRSQQTDYVATDAFPAASHEEALDKLAMIAQEQDVTINDTADRSFLVPDGEAGGLFPARAERANKFIAFDVSGNMIPSFGPGDDAGLRADLAGQDPTNGAALVGASDGAGGANWSTVQGFITKLLSTTGMATLGFVNNAPGAVPRTVLGRLRDAYVSPEDFGCVAVEDGGTENNWVQLTAALTCGRPLDGHGKTYLTSTQLAPGGNFSGVRNLGLKWTNTAAMAQQAFLLLLRDVPANTFVVNCVFDIGTIVDCGSNNDSGRGGLYVTTLNPNVTFVQGIRVEGNTFEGAGNGTRCMIRSIRHSYVIGNTVKKGTAGSTPDPTNDIANGIEVTQGFNNVVEGNVVEGMAAMVGGVATRIHTRGMLFTELRNSAIIGNTVEDVDQGFDLSGGISATNPNGNVGNTIASNSIRNVRKFGIKLANCTRHCAVVGNTVSRFGLAGIVVSSYSAPGLADATKNSSFIRIANNIVLDATGEQQANNYGIWIDENVVNGATYPRGIHVTGNLVHDTTGGGFLAYGYNNVVTYDGASNDINVCDQTNVSKGHVTAPLAGFRTPGASLYLAASQNLATATTDTINFTAEYFDGWNGHSLSSNINILNIVKSGYYNVSAYVEFATSAAGTRFAYIKRNGATNIFFNSDGAPHASVPCGLSLGGIIYLNAGDSLVVYVNQTSGGNLPVAKAQLNVLPVEVI